MVLVEWAMFVENLDQSRQQAETGVDLGQRREVLGVEGEAGAKKGANVWCEVTDVGCEKSGGSGRGGARLARAENVAAKPGAGELQRC